MALLTEQEVLLGKTKQELRRRFGGVLQVLNSPQREKLDSLIMSTVAWARLAEVVGLAEKQGGEMKEWGLVNEVLTTETGVMFRGCTLAGIEKKSSMIVNDIGQYLFIRPVGDWWEYAYWQPDAGGTGK